MNILPIIGIVGGMGPEAGASLHRYILSIMKEYKPIREDQDYIDIIHLSLGSCVPDRSLFLLKQSELNPAVTVWNILCGLNSMGRYFQRPVLSVIPCNTFYAPRIYNTLLDFLAEKPLSHIQLLHFIEETFAVSFHSDSERENIIGILCTNGSRAHHVHADILEKLGVPFVHCSPMIQDAVHRCIYDEEWGIKTTMEISAQTEAILREAVEDLRRAGAQRILLGCTELSSIENAFFQSCEIPIIDPLKTIAHVLVQRVHNQQALCGQ